MKQTREEAKRLAYGKLARRAIDSTTNPLSLDYMNFTQGNQTLVDTAFLAHAIVRAPHALWHLLDPAVKSNLVHCLKATRDKKPQYNNWYLLKENIMNRALRYAQIQESLISPEGTYPAIGRSLAYRFGAFHHLALMSYLGKLPKEIKPSQVRSALTKVIERTLMAKTTFDSNEWLTIGFYGSQAEIGEHYISTGSLYLCMTIFLPLGLDQEHEFWRDKARPWSSLKIWSEKQS